MIKRLNRWYKENKILFFVILTLFTVLFLIFSTKIFLFFNFIFGNDIIVRLSADKEVINLKHLERENISFTASVVTNPFCSAKCYYNFLGISRNKTIDKDEFNLDGGNPITKTYTLTVDEIGNGQELYQFNMECSGVNSFLCETSSEPSTRTILVTLDYGLNEEDKKLKTGINGRVDILLNSLGYLDAGLDKLDNFYNEINKTVDQNFSGNLTSLRNDIENLTFSINNTKNLWYGYSYQSLGNELDLIEEDLNFTEQTKLELENQIFKIILDYNSLLITLNSTKIKLEDIRYNRIANEQTALETAKLIVEFNRALGIFEQRNLISEKNFFVYNISAEVDSLYGRTNEIIDDRFVPITVFEVIKSINASLIDISSEVVPSNMEIIFEEPEPKCCVFGNCKSCCISEACKNDPETYPVIYLHGHAINKDLSADYSLEGFRYIQKELENAGFINAGYVTLYTPTNFSREEWGLSGVPLTIRVSYYFDVFKEPENYVIVQAKSESIDTYSIRLRDLINIIKERTGKPKVKIIAFSMGGLVARRYMQIFGDDDIETLILIGTPNKGIKGNIADYCPIIGENLECRDMNSNGLFINKLNTGKKPDLVIYNIVGTGCIMGDKKGDGVVLEENGYLDGANNYIINGTCRSSFIPLHLDLLRASIYPEVYNITLNALNVSDI